MDKVDKGQYIWYRKLTDMSPYGRVKALRVWISRKKGRAKRLAYEYEQTQKEITLMEKELERSLENGRKEAETEMKEGGKEKGMEEGNKEE